MLDDGQLEGNSSTCLSRAKRTSLVLFLQPVHEPLRRSYIKLPQPVFQVLEEEYDADRCVPRHAVEARLRERTFRCCRRGLYHKILPCRPGNVGVQHLVLPTPPERATGALHLLFMTNTRGDASAFSKFAADDATSSAFSRRLRAAAF